MDNQISLLGDTANPIVEARLQAGYSLRRLGKRLGISAQYISRAEQGTYANLNDNLVEFVCAELDIDGRLLANRYMTFQRNQRKRTASTIAPEKLSRNDSPDRGHVIFTRWREQYWPSHVMFAIAFCLHPEVVRGYEDGARSSMPNTILVALNSVDLIDKSWREVATNAMVEPR